MILTVNQDWDGLEFVSSVEHKTKPYYGIQFHPEKTMFEWKESHLTPHDVNAIKVSQYFANFFVGQGELEEYNLNISISLCKNIFFFEIIADQNRCSVLSRFEFGTYSRKKKNHNVIFF